MGFFQRMSLFPVFYCPFSVFSWITHSFSLSFPLFFFNLLDYTITETLQKTVEVEANSRQEAERLVEKNWNDSEYILDADSFVGVDFSARTNERSRDYER